jgi:hypothetical protein
MEEYIGLDVSMKDTAVSIRRDGKRIWRGKCASDPAVIADLLRKHAPSAKRVIFEGYGQSWCLASSSGLVLGLLNGFAVAEVHALDHLGEALRAVQPAPVPLGGLGELEDHGERGLA